MDYIREELLRQQRALAALMTGGEGLEEDAARREAPVLGGETGGAEAGEDAPFPWNERGTPFAARGHDTTASGGETEDAWAAEAAADADGKANMPGEKEELKSLVSRPAGRGMRTAEGGGSAGALWSAAGGRAVGDIGITSAEAGLLWAEDPPAGGAADARALSRAFQRDARRYDGGFSLY